jgi:hypothetical protein
MKTTLRGVAVLSLALVMGATQVAPASGQASTALSSLGYGTLGMVIGAAATAGATCQSADFICIPGETVAAVLIGGLAGGALGAGVASSANHRVEDGRPVGGARLAGVAMGTVLGGAAIGALGSAILVNGEGEGTPLGSDEQTISLFTLGGAAFGVWHLYRNWGALNGAPVDVRPVVAPDGHFGLRARLRF